MTKKELHQPLAKREIKAWEQFLKLVAEQLKK